ncbi:unnamed protein product [Linum trigynum]|uniref:Uncharacterized protein n=1 Tax=Linum trigynum TaxID=586398 RepID=A0AAV2CAG0_9ROSI
MTTLVSPCLRKPILQTLENCLSENEELDYHRIINISKLHPFRQKDHPLMVLDNYAICRMRPMLGIPIPHTDHWTRIATTKITHLWDGRSDHTANWQANPLRTLLVELFINTGIPNYFPLKTT